MILHLLSKLDRLHGAAVRNPWLQRLAAGTRILLAIGFIPPGLIKVLGLPFTRLGTEEPVGAFFDALYHAGPYYHFIGWGQVLAAVLLLLPWTATIGAVVYFPIILNIAVVTVALDFRGTPVITWLMLLGNVYLLCWDYDVLKSLGGRHARGGAGFAVREFAGAAGTWSALAGAAFALLAALRFGNAQQLGLAGVGGAAVAGAAFGIVLVWHQRIAFPGRAARPTPDPSPSPAGARSPVGRSGGY